MTRASQLSPGMVRSIDHFAASLMVMFPEALGVAHVGSSVTSDVWRDIDLRIVMRDELIDQLEPIVKLADVTMLLSSWGQQVTGLPVDCQLQRQTEHQSEAYGDAGSVRHHWRGKGVWREVGR